MIKGASKVIKSGIVWNKIVIRLKSINWSAAKRQPKDPNPVIVLIDKPVFDLISKACFPRW